MRCYALGAAIMATAVGSQAWAQDIITLDDALAKAGIDQSGKGEAEQQAADNPRLYGPRAQEDAAIAAIQQAQLRPRPELTFETENFAGTGVFSGLQSSEFTLSIGRQIEWGDKRGARIASAQASAQLAGLNRSSSAAQLALTVRERYIEAVAAGQKVALARDIALRNRELARIANVLVEVGREPPLRAMRADAMLAEAEADLQSAEADDLAARHALAALWGATGPVPQVQVNYPDLASPITLPDPAAALPLQIAHARTALANAEIAREQSLGVPDPTVSAGVRRFEGEKAQAFVVGVTIPLPFGNRNQGNIAAAQAHWRAAQAEEAVAATDYRLAVEQARTLYAAAAQRADTLRQASLPQADEALRLVEIGYRNGRFPLIEVLEAADARDSIRKNLIEADVTRSRLAARLIWLSAQ